MRNNNNTKEAKNELPEISKDQIRQKQTEALLQVFDSFNYGEKPYMAAIDEYLGAWKEAEKGIIMIPERIRKLYPIFREIIDEQNEIKVFWSKFERKEELRLERKQQKEKECIK